MTSMIYREQVAPRKLVWVGPLTIISAIIVNLIIRSIAIALFGAPAAFHYMQASYIIGGTIVYLLMALLAFVLVGRFARRPIQFYRWLALVALCVSLLTPVMALTGALATPGMNLSIFWTMIAMHIVTAAITVGLLTTLARS
jgi:hypothetical protein